jgi:HSP20 family protein
MAGFGAWGSDPFGGFERLRREMDEAFGRFAGGGLATARSNVFPPVNVYETQDDYVLTAEVPGLRIEDLNVTIESGRVTLRGERKIEFPEAASLHRRERQSGFFRRAVDLPQPVESEKVEAHYRNGILVVKLPKTAASRPRQIDVQAR